MKLWLTKTTNDPARPGTVQLLCFRRKEKKERKEEWSPVKGNTYFKLTLKKNPISPAA